MNSYKIRIIESSSPRRAPPIGTRPYDHCYNWIQAQSIGNRMYYIIDLHHR